MNVSCPVCHNHTLLPINGNKQYQLTEIDGNGGILLGAGVPVHLVGCTTCGHVVLHNPELIGKQPQQ